MDGLSKLAKANLWTLRNHRNIFHPQRRAIPGHDDRPLNVLRTVDQSDGTHINLLQALLDEAASRVLIVVGELLFDLSQAQAIGNEFVGVNANLVFAGGAA